MEFIDFSAKTVNDCITKACEHFQVPSSKLEYEVKDNGSLGFLGIGAREAKIVARAKSDEEILQEEKAIEEEEKARALREKREEDARMAAKAAMEEANKAEKTVVLSETGYENSSNEVVTSYGGEYSDYDDEISFGGHGGRRERRGRSESGGKGRHHRNSHSSSKRSNANFVVIEDKNNIKQFYSDLFKAMDLEVNVELKYAEEERILDVDFSGPSMGILIGKRGQTLDALQYLTSLVVNKGEEQYIHVKVDTENYRKRRKDTLENLAKNISFKVKKSRRPVSLEPMNPYERRIIHSTLQNDRFVTTYSEGNEPFRRVVVAPKFYKQHEN